VWLQRVLDSPQPAHCDSIMIGGLVELLRTQGLWMHSLRLAYHQVGPHRTPAPPTQQRAARSTAAGFSLLKRGIDDVKDAEP
jgi:hypothetical protein